MATSLGPILWTAAGPYIKYLVQSLANTIIDMIPAALLAKPASTIVPIPPPTRCQPTSSFSEIRTLFSSGIPAPFQYGDLLKPFFALDVSVYIFLAILLVTTVSYFRYRLDISISDIEKAGNERFTFGQSREYAFPTDGQPGEKDKYEFRLRTCVLNTWTADGCWGLSSISRTVLCGFIAGFLDLLCDFLYPPRLVLMLICRVAKWIVRSLCDGVDRFREAVQELAMQAELRRQLFPQERVLWVILCNWMERQYNDWTASIMQKYVEGYHYFSEGLPVLGIYFQLWFAVGLLWLRERIAKLLHDLIFFTSFIACWLAIVLLQISIGAMHVINWLAVPIMQGLALAFQLRLHIGDDKREPGYPDYGQFRYMYHQILEFTNTSPYEMITKFDTWLQEAREILCEVIPSEERAQLLSVDDSIASTKKNIHRLCSMYSQLLRNTKSDPDQLEAEFEMWHEGVRDIYHKLIPAHKRAQLGSVGDILEMIEKRTSSLLKSEEAHLHNVQGLAMELNMNFPEFHNIPEAEMHKRLRKLRCYIRDNVALEFNMREAEIAPDLALTTPQDVINRLAGDIDLLVEAS